MPVQSSVPGGEAIPEQGVRPVRGPPARRAVGPADVTLLLVEDRDRIAASMNDIVVSRLFATGLSLETALSLMDDHRAAGRIREVISELDLAIRDLRDVVFDHHRHGQPSEARPG
jgi:signal transduction histidine kinase